MCCIIFRLQSKEIPKVLTGQPNCVTFQEYYTHKLQEQVDMLPNDSDANKLWPKLKEKMGEFFEGLDIKPSLLHGDLWSGNAGQVGSTPVIYDASSFYGHHEYDLAIAGKYFFLKVSRPKI